MARASTIRVSIRGLDNAEGARRFTSFRCVSGNYTDTDDDIIQYDDVVKAMQRGKNP
jgi:hypothetical protein